MKAVYEDGGIASLGSGKGPHGDLLVAKGTTRRPVSGPKTTQIAGPPHNSGLNGGPS